MGWPPFWGPHFWFFIHASAFAYKPVTVISVAVRLQIKNFYILLALLLPCPGCQYHFQAYLKSDPWTGESGESLWQYTIAAHNAVNERTGKLIFSEDEAVKSLQNTLELYGYNHVTDFVRAYWIVPVFTAYTFMGNNKDAASAEQQVHFSRFVQTLPFIFPFTSQNQTLQTKLVSTIQGLLDIKIPTNTHEALLFYNYIFNFVAEHSQLNIPLENLDTFTKTFNDLIETREYVNLVRCHQIRVEDHAKMRLMQANEKRYINALICVSSVLVFTLILCGIQYKRLRIKREA